MSNPGVLAGRTALLLRSADRAAATVSVLATRGARTAVCQLIDFELPADTAELDAHLVRMLDGAYDWCVFTSVNTLTALSLRAAALGVEFRIPAGTRVAVVGQGTADAVRALGTHPDFMPATDHSARGMLADWQDLHASKASVFAPQADIASATLRDGFAAHGWQADIVIAYSTVSAPADPARALHRPPATGQVLLPAGGYLLEVAQLSEALAGIDAVMFSSPSTVDTFLALLAEPSALLAGGQTLLAIGDSTAARLREHGLEPAGIAALPTPEGLATAWEGALGANSTAHAAAPTTTPHT